MSNSYLSISNILNRYGLSRTTFFKLRKSGYFPNPVTPKNFNPRWSLDDLLSWEAQNNNSQDSTFSEAEA
ncbi:helix-turn-helix transcriptional regulator [Pseudoalteromonas rhizosphaerae]|uniref:helix-turn-helix transcriptional regulator n=1 Tax=Pseudoalteromonas rhizosphaerae TaxID=2518973 RepID=UPI0037044EB1